MASSHLAFFISSLLLLPLAFPSIAAYGDIPQEKKSEVVVEGMVYCQSCDNYGPWSLSKAEPIASSKVSVTCKNYKNQVSFYKAFETEGNGYFFAELEGFQMSNSLLDHPLQSCHVQLVSSPLGNCNLLSNVNYGPYGSPLRYENKRLYRKDYDVVIYAAGPLAFRPAAHCPAPAHH
ncbi:non-classical arabinogalactan protein 30-like [Durio zibethinus]|uniref:Non-classical arabinogalactan protein 30-like n=1 Tax=Durio zibethinus TaxID=66656 RepID=A0A6P5Z1D6_DURZI|nr:non-classical arabinogalactan protein 30-like [Durio zibethinus]